jgi:RNA polymerase sigma-70 factor (ECF subfamily)
VPTDPAASHLSNISTCWSIVRKAHGDRQEAVAAKRELLERYGKAVKRYLGAVIREPDAPDELSQEFALRVMSGSCLRAEPDRGRFRDYVKGVLHHLVADHFRRMQAAKPVRLASERGADLADEATSDRDAQFLLTWREGLLARAWAELARLEQQTGQVGYTVLRFRADHPDLRSEQMAEQLSAQLGKRLTAAGVRQTLRRARDKFLDLVLGEVASTVAEPTVTELEDELAELGLLEYCRPALERYRDHT